MELKKLFKALENAENSVPVPRYLLASDLAYDTPQTTFSQNPSINRGDQSEKSVSKLVNKSDYESKLPN